MHVVIVHNYAHRLRNDGILESAPVKLFGLPSDPADSKDVILKAGTWEVRSAEECGLAGADQNNIKKTLELWKHQIPEPYASMKSEPPKEQILSPRAAYD